MNFLIPILLLGGGGLIYSLGRTSDAADRLMKKLKGLRVKSFSGGAINFSLDLQISNPSSKTLYVDYVFMDFALPSGPLAELRIETPGEDFPIPGNRSTIISIPFTVSLLSLVRTVGVAVVNLFTSGKLPPSVKAVGEIKVNGIATKFDETIPITKA